jgi:hypothetical protein
MMMMMMMREIDHAGANESIYYALYIFLKTMLVTQLVMKFPVFIETQIIPCPQKPDSL